MILHRNRVSAPDSISAEERHVGNGCLNPPVPTACVSPKLMAFSVQGQFDRWWGGDPGPNVNIEKEPQRERGTLAPTVGPGSSAGLANAITAAANVCSPAAATYTSLTSSFSLMARWWIPTTHHLGGWATALLSTCCIIFFVHIHLLGGGFWRALCTCGRD